MGDHQQGDRGVRREDHSPQGSTDLSDTVSRRSNKGDGHSPKGPRERGGEREGRERSGDEGGRDGRGEGGERIGERGKEEGGRSSKNPFTGASPTHDQARFAAPPVSLLHNSDYPDNLPFAGNLSHNQVRDILNAPQRMGQVMTKAQRGRMFNKVVSQNAVQNRSLLIEEGRLLALRLLEEEEHESDTDSLDIKIETSLVPIDPEEGGARVLPDDNTILIDEANNDLGQMADSIAIEASGCSRPTAATYTGLTPIAYINNSIINPVKGRNNPVEKGEFSGNVEKFAQQVIPLISDTLASIVPEGRQNFHLLPLMYGAVSSSSVAVNNLTAQTIPFSQGVKQEYDLAPRTGDKIFSSSSTYTKTDRDSKTKETTQHRVSETHVKKDGDLKSSAKRLVASMLSAPNKVYRVSSFISKGHINVKYCTAVCRVLIHHPSFSESKLKKFHNNHNDITALISSVRCWASKDVDLVEISDNGKDPKALALMVQEYNEGIESVDIDLVQEQARAIAHSPILLRACLSAKVCVYCLSASLHDVDIPAEIPTNTRHSSSIGAIVALVKEENCTGALQAMAKAHNKDMHASNGNISFKADLQESRSDLINRMITHALVPGTKTYAGNPNPRMMLNDAEVIVDSMVVRPGPLTAFPVVSAQGTMHQYLSRVADHRRAYVVEQALDRGQEDVEGAYDGCTSEESQRRRGVTVRRTSSDTSSRADREGSGEEDPDTEDESERRPTSGSKVSKTFAKIGTSMMDIILGSSAPPKVSKQKQTKRQKRESKTKTKATQSASNAGETTTVEEGNAKSLINVIGHSLINRETASLIVEKDGSTQANQTIPSQQSEMSGQPSTSAVPPPPKLIQKKGKRKLAANSHSMLTRSKVSSLPKPAMMPPVRRSSQTSSPRLAQSLAQNLVSSGSTGSFLDRLSTCDDSDFLSTASHFAINGGGDDQRLQALWYGVETGMSEGIGRVTIMPEVSAWFNLLSDPSKVTPAVNMRGPEHIANFLANAVCLRSWLMAYAPSSRPDLRTRTLKVALYEHLRERRVTNPLGVQWGVPVRGPPVVNTMTLERVDEWNYECAAVDYSIIEFGLSTDGSIEMAGGQTWRLNDPALVVMVIDKDISNQPSAHALMLISLLQYPLIWKTEWFGVSSPDVPNAWELHQFLRTSGLVDIQSSVNKILLISTDRRSTIQIGHTRVTFAHSDHRDHYVPVPIHPANELVTDCLQVCMDGALNLRKMWDNCVASRMSSQAVDWIEIDNVMAMLCVRYPVQPEMETEGNNIEYSFHGPNSADQVDFSHWYHEATANCYDMKPAPREIAREHPVLSWGDWSNSAELAIGLHLALYSEETHTADADAVAQAVVTPADLINRADYPRRALEEWKAAQGISDEILEPMIAQMNVNLWEVLCYGDNRQKDFGGLKALFCAVVGDEKDRKFHVSWQVNRQHVAVVSITGVRTNMMAWLNSTSGTTGTSLADVTSSYACYKNRAGHYSNYWVQNSQLPFDDPVIQRIIQKVNIITNPQLFARKQWPDNDIIVTTTSRYMSGQFTGLWVQAGWTRHAAAITNDAINAAWSFAPISFSKEWDTNTANTMVVSTYTQSLLQSSSLIAGVVLAEQLGQLPTDLHGLDVLETMTQMSLNMRTPSVRKIDQAALPTQSPIDTSQQREEGANLDFQVEASSHHPPIVGPSGSQPSVAPNPVAPPAVVSGGDPNQPQNPTHAQGQTSNLP